MSRFPNQIIYKDKIKDFKMEYRQVVLPRANYNKFVQISRRKMRRFIFTWLHMMHERSRSLEPNADADEPIPKRQELIEKFGLPLPEDVERNALLCEDEWRDQVGLQLSTGWFHVGGHPTLDRNVLMFTRPHHTDMVTEYNLREEDFKDGVFLHRDNTLRVWHWEEWADHWSEWGEDSDVDMDDVEEGDENADQGNTNYDNPSS